MKRVRCVLVAVVFAVVIGLVLVWQAAVNGENRI